MTTGRINNQVHCDLCKVAPTPNAHHAHRRTQMQTMQDSLLIRVAPSFPCFLGIPCFSPLRGIPCFFDRFFPSFPGILGVREG